MLVPSVSAATVMVQPKALVFGGIGIIVRVMVAWYLSRREVADTFRRSASGRLRLCVGGRAPRPSSRAKLGMVFAAAPHKPYFFARAVAFSPTRSLTLNVIFPAFLSASTIT